MLWQSRRSAAAEVGRVVAQGLRDELGSVVILVVLYMMQGVPLGLTMGAMCAPCPGRPVLFSINDAIKCCARRLECNCNPSACAHSFAWACAWPSRLPIAAASTSCETLWWVIDWPGRVVVWRTPALLLRLHADAVRRPFLLQSRASYTAIGIFSVASYPYSFKLLWSPVVDSVYSLAFGRRKSWVVRRVPHAGRRASSRSKLLPGFRFLNLGINPTLAFACCLLWRMMAVTRSAWALHGECKAPCGGLGYIAPLLASVAVCLWLSHHCRSSRCHCWAVKYIW